MSIYQHLSKINGNQHYIKRYCKFINTRQQIKGYTESHHILPVSLFPEFAEVKENIINLSAREHYIAHLLLHKAFPKNNKMLWAIWCMCNGWENNFQQRNISSKAFDRLKTSFSNMMSKRMSIPKNNPWTKQKAKQTIIDTYGGLGNASPIIQEKQKKTTIEKYGVDNIYKHPEFIEQNRLRTIERNKDPEYKKSQSIAIKNGLKDVDRTGENNNFYNKTHSVESKLKISEAKRGKKQIRCSCIICKKEIGINNINNHYKKHK